MLLPHLTGFESRLLPLLAAQLSLAQIATLIDAPLAQVQRAAESVYRKLGLTERELSQR